MGGFASGSGNVDTTFNRDGVSATSQVNTPPSYLTGLIQQQLSQNAIPSSLAANQNSFLNNLLSRDTSQVQGKSTVDDIVTMTPGSFTGNAALSSIAGQDPYSDTFRDAQESYFDDAFAQAAAAARTGPVATRGGVAHGGYAEGNVLEKAALDKFREITELQQRQAAVTTNAAQTLQGIEMGRRGQVLQAQDQLQNQVIGGDRVGVAGSGAVGNRAGTEMAGYTGLGQMLGSKSGTTTDALTGRGQQQSSHMGWNTGLQCCFIFLEGLNGQLPWYVRHARDNIGTPQIKHGYRRMAKWLCPAMRDHEPFKQLINRVMIKPFLRWGAKLYGDETVEPVRRFDETICKTWFRIWNFLGR